MNSLILKDMDNRKQAPADLVRSVRRVRGWSQAALADEIGCSQPTISRIENGESPIMPELVGVFAMVLGVQRADLRPDLFEDYGTTAKAAQDHHGYTI